MISETEINKLAIKYQTLELNVKREYFQHLFLSYFYQQKNSAAIFFRGGTALRIIYQSPRFSEDLDFSTDLKNIELLEQAIVSTLQSIERESVLVDSAEAKETSGGYLAIINFQEESKPLVIQLEISLRQKSLFSTSSATKNPGEVVTIAGDFIPPYVVIRLNQEQLVAEKIEALMFRKKPRDFYDFYYILRSNLMSLKQKKMLPRALKVLQATNINFEAELKQFLPKTHWEIIRNFKETLKKEIERYL